MAIIYTLRISLTTEGFSAGQAGFDSTVGPIIYIGQVVDSAHSVDVYGSTRW